MKLGAFLIMLFMAGLYGLARFFVWKRDRNYISPSKVNDCKPGIFKQRDKPPGGR